MIRTRTKTEYIAVCDSCGAELSTVALNEPALSRFATAAKWIEPQHGHFMCRPCQVLAQAKPNVMDSEA